MDLEAYLKRFAVKMAFPTSNLAEVNSDFCKATKALYTVFGVFSQSALSISEAVASEATVRSNDNCI